MNDVLICIFIFKNKYLHIIMPDNLPKQLYTVAFYNLENLFDIYDDEMTNDNDFLPTSAKRWTHKRYQNKIRKLGYSVSRIGLENTNNPPTIIGLAEVENSFVLDDLLNSTHLKDFPYDYIHYDSPDERGIDVALVFNKDVFTIENTETFPVHIYDEDGSIDYTRDILLVTGFINNERIHILVNHWPSRHGGETTTEIKRIIAANNVTDIINGIKNEDSHAKIIVTGDFNDDPYSNSIKKLVSDNNLYNPMDTLLSDTLGTTSHNFSWSLFDQIMISTNFFETKADKLSLKSTHIFNADFLRQFHGRYKDTPFRTYVGKKYKGGYSDHFPVYMVLKTN